MGTCSEDPHPCWASRLLGLISLFLSVCSSGTNSDGGPGPGAQDSGAPDPLQGIRGGSVLFPLLKKQDAELEEVAWGFGPGSEYRVLLRVRPGEAPIWVSLQDRYQQRIHVPNMTSLKIENLTSEDSGLYRARVSFTGGVEFTHVFHLTVYEPIPSPEILAGPRSITPGWCNVTLECGPRGATKDLNVTWKREYISEELEQTGTLGPASNSHTLAVRLPLRQPYSSITCVVSNQMDQKTATVGLGEVCAHGSQGLPIAGSLGAIVVLLLILGSGLCFWKKCGKKKIEMRRGAGSPEDQKDDDSIQYVELNQQESQEGLYMGVSEQHSGPLTTIYSEVCKPGHAMKII
uniref:Ig-like domain-containing protein n=1 Tax=Sus scrofa TaxID=9823 RepID=A0A8D1YXB1_PIG